MKNLIDLIKFISWDYIIIFAVVMSFPLLFFPVGEDRYNVETTENHVLIIKNFKAYIFPGSFLIASILSFGLRAYKAKRQKKAVKDENQDQKMDRVSDGCLVYFFILPILIGSFIGILSQARFKIELDGFGGYSKTGIIFENKHTFTKEEIDYVDIETKRGRMYVIDVVHIKLKNGDDVYPDANYEGDMAVKKHIEDVWRMEIYVPDQN
ncbi:MAG: hypothetical protein K8R86_02920 [Bacteroidales bacterium]|nr:hypothetical protein [Bacteroidales bacterium]